MGKECNDCGRADVPFHPKRAVCRDCYNENRRNKNAKNDGDFALILAEARDIRALVLEVRDINTTLRNENQRLCHEAKDYDSKLAKMQAEINDICVENKELRELLHTSPKSDEGDALARMQAEIKEVREENKELRESLCTQDGRIEDIVQIQNEIQFAAPKYSPDASDLGSRCDRIENSLETLEKAQTELTEEQKQHAKYTKIGFETIRSQFGDDKIGNKVLATKIDALTTVVAKLEDPDKTPKPSPKTPRKASTPKKQ